MAFINTLPVPPSVWMGETLSQLRKENLHKFLEARRGLVDRYSGDNLHKFITPYFDADDLKNEVLPARQNLIDRAIRRISLVYKNEPQYEYTGELPEEYDSMGRWKAMRQAERMANLMGSILLYPNILDGKMQYDIIWYYIPLFEDDPFRPSAIMYPLDIPVTGDIESIKWAYWDDENFIILDDNMKHTVSDDNPEEKNIFGVLPFISVHIQPQIDEYFVSGYGWPLADANDSINIALTEMRFGARFSLMGQYVATGLEKGTTVKMGANKVLGIPDGATIGAVNPPAKMDLAVEYLKV